MEDFIGWLKQNNLFEGGFDTDDKAASRGGANESGKYQVIPQNILPSPAKRAGLESGGVMMKKQMKKRMRKK